MHVSPINSLRDTTPVRQTAKTAKVSKGEAPAKSEDSQLQPVQAAQAKGGNPRKQDRRAAPKSPEAISSNAVQAALMNLQMTR